MSVEELRQKVRDFGPLVDRLNECRSKIGSMCSQRRGPTMSIPVQWDDDDFFISTTLKDAMDELRDPGKGGK